MWSIKKAGGWVSSLATNSSNTSSNEACPRERHQIKSSQTIHIQICWRTGRKKIVNDILNRPARADPIATQQKVLLLHFCVMHFCLKVDHSAQTATCHRSKHGGFKGIWQKRAKCIEAGHREIQHVNEFCLVLQLREFSCWTVHPTNLQAPQGGCELS